MRGTAGRSGRRRRCAPYPPAANIATCSEALAVALEVCGSGHMHFSITSALSCPVSCWGPSMPIPMPRSLAHDSFLENANVGNVGVIPMLR